MDTASGKRSCARSRGPYHETVMVNWSEEFQGTARKRSRKGALSSKWTAETSNESGRARMGKIGKTACFHGVIGIEPQMAAACCLWSRHEANHYEGQTCVARLLGQLHMHAPMGSFLCLKCIR
ncbi:hypothetical protein MRX96_047787 [Rhipicephalus microplus]